MVNLAFCNSDYSPSQGLVEGQKEVLVLVQLYTYVKTVTLHLTVMQNRLHGLFSKIVFLVLLLY